MSRRNNNTFDNFDADEDAPTQPGQLTSNGHWLFGSLFAILVLTGLAFGVWTGASKPKPAEVTEKKDGDKPSVTPQPPPSPQPKQKDDPKPEPKKDEPKKEEPKKDDPKPEPKKDEPKKDEPKPEPKKEEPKKDPMLKPVAFTEVKPLLLKYCGTCHGQSAGKPKGGIDLRTVAAIKKGGDNGDILTPGEPTKSKLYTSMLPGAAEFMPPDGKPGPNEKELKIIHDWIATGAKERRAVRGVRNVRRRFNRVQMELTPRPPSG